MSAAPRGAALVTALLLPVLAAWSAPASASVTARFAGAEAGVAADFDQVNEVGGTVRADASRAFSGAFGMRVQYDGGTQNAYQRGIWHTDLRDGDDLWYSAAFYFPVGFKAQMQGEVDVLRWDNWVSHPSDTDWGGLVIYGSDKRMRLMRFNGAGTGTTMLVGPFDVPEGRWVRLEVHQRLGTSNALSEVFMDGALVGRSTAANTYGRTIERLRVGIVAIDAGRQTNPLALWVDDARISTASVWGASGAEPTAPTATAPTTDTQTTSESTSTTTTSTTTTSTTTKKKGKRSARRASAGDAHFARAARRMSPAHYRRHMAHHRRVLRKLKRHPVANRRALADLRAHLAAHRAAQRGS